VSTGSSTISRLSLNENGRGVGNPSIVIAVLFVGIGLMSTNVLSAGHFSKRVA